MTIDTVTQRWTRVDSPIGDLLLTSSGEGLSGLYLSTHVDKGTQPEMAAGWEREDDHFSPVVGQLEGYFAGERRTFDLQLSPVGTPFQHLVWSALREIPYGETRSYGAIAARVGKPGAARAVGLANGRNPISIIVPCHRVIGSTGTLTGYGGGLERKQFLLDLELQRSHGAARLV